MCQSKGTEAQLLCPWSKVSQWCELFPVRVVIRIYRYSILPAISLDGVLHLDILTSSWTAEEFRAYVEVLLTRMNPYPQPNSVLVCDNTCYVSFGLTYWTHDCCLLRTYVSPFSLSAVSSHVLVSLLILGPV
jgi:hypothetical protein